MAFKYFFKKNINFVYAILYMNKKKLAKKTCKAVLIIKTFILINFSLSIKFETKNINIINYLKIRLII